MSDNNLDHALMEQRLEDDEAAAYRIHRRKVAAVANGAVGVLQAALELAAGPGFPGLTRLLDAAAVGFAKEACDEMKRDARDADLKKQGHATPLLISSIGSGKGEFLRAQWKELFKNSIDPTFAHDIRIEDIEFGNTLNTTDAVLIYMIGKHAQALNDSWMVDPATTKIGYPHLRHDFASNDSFMKELTQSGSSLEHVLKCFETVIGAKTSIPIDELHHALLTRGARPADARKPHQLFLLSAYASKTCKYLETRVSQGHPAGDSPLLTGRFFCAALTDEATRWLKLIDARASRP